MKRTFLLIGILVLLFVSSALIFADLRGRDLTLKGEIKTLTGVVKIENSEWYLLSGNNKYLVHKGPEFYLEEIGLNINENDRIAVNGYVFENEITPVKITVNQKDYSFRDNSGRPLWAGRGQGRNRNFN